MAIEHFAPSRGRQLLEELALSTTHLSRLLEQLPVYRADLTENPQTLQRAIEARAHLDSVAFLVTRILEGR